MKKILFLFILTLSLGSCSLDNGNDDAIFSDAFVPIESVTLPPEFEYGETYLIDYSYYRPSTCHHFLNLYQEINLNTRTIAVVNRIVTGPDECSPFQDELVTRSFNITIDNMDTYIYKFWQGADSNGQDVYLQMEVPVIE